MILCNRFCIFLNLYHLSYQQIMDASTEEVINDLSKDDDVLNLLSQCGENSVLNVSMAI